MRSGKLPRLSLTTRRLSLHSDVRRSHQPGHLSAPAPVSATDRPRRSTRYSPFRASRKIATLAALHFRKSQGESRDEQAQDSRLRRAGARVDRRDVRRRSTTAAGATGGATTAAGTQLDILFRQHRARQGRRSRRTRGSGSALPENWRRRRVRAARPGAPISARRPRVARRPSTRAIASGTAPGRISRVRLSLKNVDDLHSDNNKLNMQTSLTERGADRRRRGLTRRIVTTSSPARSRTAGPSPPARIAPAATGRAAPGCRDGRPHRPQGIARRCRSQVMERVAPSRGPTAAAARADLSSTGGNRPVLLLRRPIGGPASFAKGGRACKARPPPS